MTDTKPKKDTSIHACKRTPAQKLQDLADISKLFLDGLGQRQMVEWIAANRPYTLSIAMINRIVKDCVRYWEESVEKNIGKLKARDLMRLADVERRAVEAWERSMKPAEEISNAKETETPNEEKPEANKEVKPLKLRGNKLRESKTTKNRDGDPRFLSIILECVRQRAEIVGYCKPKKLELSTEDGQPLKLDVGIQAALERAYGAKPEVPAIAVTSTVTTQEQQSEPPKDWRAVMAGK